MNIHISGDNKSSITADLLNTAASIVKEDPMFLKEFYVGLKYDLYSNFKAIELFGTLKLSRLDNDQYDIYYEIHKDDYRLIKDIFGDIFKDTYISIGKFPLNEKHYLLSIINDDNCYKDLICGLYSFTLPNTDYIKYSESATPIKTDVSSLSLNKPVSEKYIMAYPVSGYTDYTYSFETNNVINDSGHTERFIVAALLEALRVFKVKTKEDLLKNIL